MSDSMNEERSMPVRVGWRILRGVIAVAAVAFAVLTAYNVIGAIGSFMRSGDIAGHTYYIHSETSTSESGAVIVESAFGLMYKGVWGFVWAITQVGAVAAAMLMSFMPARRWRLLGVLILVAWAGLWVFNAAWMTIHGDARFFGQFVVMYGLGFAVMVLYAVQRLMPKRRA